MFKKIVNCFRRSTNDTLPISSGKGKCDLTNSNILLENAFFKTEKFKVLCEAQGWHRMGPKKDGRGKYVAFAKKIGCTKQYATGVAKGIFVVQGPLFFRIIRLVQGDLSGDWKELFDVRPSYSGIHPNHPALNRMKEEGIVPYTKYSPSADFRSADYAVEREEQDTKKVVDKK